MPDTEPHGLVFLTAHDLETLTDEQVRAITLLVGENPSPRIEKLLDGLDDDQRDAVMRMAEERGDALIEPSLIAHGPIFLAKIRGSLGDLPPPGAERTETLRRIVTQASDALFEAIRADLIEAIAAETGPTLRP